MVIQHGLPTLKLLLHCDILFIWMALCKGYHHVLVDCFSEGVEQCLPGIQGAILLSPECNFFFSAEQGIFMDLPCCKPKPSMWVDTLLILLAWVAFDSGTACQPWQVLFTRGSGEVKQALDSYFYSPPTTQHNCVWIENPCLAEKRAWAFKRQQDRLLNAWQLPLYPHLKSSLFRVVVESAVNVNKAV